MKTICVIQVLCVGWSLLHAAPGPLGADPAERPLERRLLADAQDGVLHHDNLLTAALIAGGVQRKDDLDRYRREFNGLCELAAAGHDPDRPAHEEAERLFELLHTRFLTGGYQSGCSRLNRTFSSRTYNCVTATVLYHCLCERFGLEPTGMATRGHVFTRIAGDPPLDVETTCRNWFASSRETAERDEVSGEIDEVSGEIQVPRRNGSVREINEVQLIGKIYYNRAVEQLSQENFSKAVRLLRTSLRMDSRDQATRENLLAAINNWSLDECRKGRYEQAARLLREGLVEAPDYGPFRTNDLHVHQKWVKSLCRQDRFDEAIRLLEQGYERRPEAELFDRGRYLVYGLWARSLFQRSQTLEAWQVLAEARSRYAKDADLLQHEASAIGRAVRKLARQGLRRQAIAVLKQGLELQPDSGDLQRLWSDLTEREL